MLLALWTLGQILWVLRRIPPACLVASTVPLALLPQLARHAHSGTMVQAANLHVCYFCFFVVVRRVCIFKIISSLLEKRAILISKLGIDFF